VIVIIISKLVEVVKKVLLFWGLTNLISDNKFEDLSVLILYKIS